MPGTCHEMGTQTVSCDCDTVPAPRCLPSIHSTHPLIRQIFMELLLSTRLSSRLQRHQPCPHGVYSLTGRSAWVTENYNIVEKSQVLERSPAETERCEDSGADTKQRVCRRSRGWGCREDFRVTAGPCLDGCVGSLWEEETGCGARWGREERISCTKRTERADT